MRNAIVVLSVFLFSAFGFTEIQEPIPNLQNPRYEIYTSGQPSGPGFEQAAAMGVKTVINVLPEKECLENEEELVAGQKMVYRAFPFQTSDFKLETIRKFGELLREQRKPVLIHCSTGNHAGGLWFAYRVLIEKAPLGAALREARSIGLKKELEDSMFDWVVNESEMMRDNEVSGS